MDMCAGGAEVAGDTADVASVEAQKRGDVVGGAVGRFSSGGRGGRGAELQGSSADTLRKGKAIGERSEGDAIVDQYGGGVDGALELANVERPGVGEQGTADVVVE